MDLSPKKNLKQKILFLLGVASALAVELLTKGPWSHVVWAPAAIMLFTDLAGVVDTKKAIAAIPQRVRMLIAMGVAVSVEILAKGRWAHAVWAPMAIMLFTDMRDVLGIPQPATAPAIAPPAPPADNTETVTPLDKPPPTPK